MKNNRRLTILILLCVVCLIVGSLGSCAPQPPPTIMQVADFALNEIIVTGPKDEVDRVVDDPATPNLELITEVDLRYLAQRSDQNPDEYPQLPTASKLERDRLFDASQYSSLVMRLYKNLDDISTLLEKVSVLNETGNKGKVFADPNYLTDPLQGNGSCGKPFSGGGSPFSGGGSPFSGGGSPFSGGGSPLTGLGIDNGINKDTFKHQWAFKSSPTAQGGISVPENSFIMGSEGDESLLSGNDSTVGVFDTSPWTFNSEPWTGNPAIPLADGSQLNLSVSDSIIKYSGAATTSPATSSQIDVRNHGLFVTSLVKAIAPESDIHLYRVLGDDGCGSLFVLSAAMHEFVRDMSLDKGNLQNVVINLSLGVHVPDGINYQLQAGNNLPPQIAALDTAIYEANRLGAVIVAASGNDSASSNPNITIAAQNMQLPAFYSNVIGVAASNRDGQRSCFSNMGDVAAPGGNGGEISNANPGQPAKPCAPRTTITDALAAPNPCNLTDMGMCPYGVIGLYLDLASSSPSSPSFNYGLWSGTSFSTPLVSGLSALAFEKAGGDRGAVYCLIEQGAQAGNPALGWGIINIANSMDSTSCLP